MIILSKEEINLSSKDCEKFDELFTELKNKNYDSDFTENFQKAMRIILAGFMVKTCCNNHICCLTADHLFNLAKGFCCGIEPILIDQLDLEGNPININLNTKSGEIIFTNGAEKYKDSFLLESLRDIKVFI